MASLVYNNAKGKFLEGLLHWSSGGDTFKVMLVTSSYTPDKDHDFVSSASSYELSGTGYTGGFGGSGRKTLANKATTVDDTNDLAKVTADSVVWSAIDAGTAAAAIIIKEVSSDADSLLIAYIDFTDAVTNGGDLTLNWNAAGIFSFA